LARISWTIPITLLATMSKPNMPLITEPVASTMISSTPRIALILVKTLARMMSTTPRVARSGISLPLPWATRCATSASVRPEAVMIG